MITEPVVLHPRRYAGMSAAQVVEALVCRHCWNSIPANRCTCRAWVEARARETYLAGIPAEIAQGVSTTQTHQPTPVRPAAAVLGGKARAA